MHIAEALSPRDIYEARLLVLALEDELRDVAGIDLEADGFSEKMAGFPGPFAPPSGALILARDDETAAGCVGLKPFEDGAAEIRGLYVAPAYRGEKLGLKLLTAAVNAAHMRGLRSVCLDSLPQLGHAIALYERLGFAEIGPYRQSPHIGMRYFRLVLQH